MKVDVVDSDLVREEVLGMDRLVREAVSCGEGSDGPEEETRPAWDVEWAEADVGAEGGVEDRYTLCLGCRSPNGHVYGWARPDHRLPYLYQRTAQAMRLRSSTRAILLRNVHGQTAAQNWSPGTTDSVTGGEGLGNSRAMTEVQFSSTSAVEWAEMLYGRAANPRHHWEWREEFDKRRRAAGRQSTWAGGRAP